MKSLSDHDLESLLGILLRVKKSHEILLKEVELIEKEKHRLRDELEVFERIIPKIANAISDSRS
jgi:hypothetical protein